MRWFHCVSILILTGLASPALAQPGAVESVPHEMVVKAVQQLNARFSLEGEAYVIQVNDRTLTLHRLEDGKRLLLRANIKGQVSLPVLNFYNDKHAITTRAIHAGKGGVNLETGFDCQLGITQAGLAKLIQRFAKEAGEFEAFAAKNQDKGGPIEEPKLVKKTDKVEAPAKRPVPMQIRPASDDKEIVITFPTHEKENWETAWKIVWDMESAQQANDQGFKRIAKDKKGEIKEMPGFRSGREAVLFKIKQAYFKPGQKAEWIQVLEDAHPSELYVPYYFKGTRFFDLRDVGGYVALNAKEGGATSQLLSKSKRVMAELRDTGPTFKHGNITRRGEELTLWANFGAANYTYMIEYGFRDDGTIVFRHAPTGYNFFPHFDASHMHGSYWRIGMKLGPVGKAVKNQVFAVSLPLEAKDQGDGGKLSIREVTKESFLDWSPGEFTRIRISNPEYSIVPEGKNRPALPISYDLVTVQQGTARHKRFDDEKFTHHDFWITRQDSPEKMYVNLGGYFFDSKGDANPKLRDLEQSNVVLWHSSSALHVPRSEDGIVKGNSSTNGQAMIYWTSFELRPRNLFMTTPFYPSAQK